MEGAALPASLACTCNDIYNIFDLCATKEPCQMVYVGSSCSKLLMWQPPFKLSVYYCENDAKVKCSLKTVKLVSVSAECRELQGCSH